MLGKIQDLIRKAISEQTLKILRFQPWNFSRTNLQNAWPQNMPVDICIR